MAKTKVRTRRRYFSRARMPRGKRKPTISLAIMGGMSVPVIQAVNVYKYAGVVNALSNFTQNMTGFVPTTGEFHVEYIKKGLLPVMGGALIHKVASMVGLNRMIAQAGVPFIRI